MGMATINFLSVKRTGKVYSFAASEFEVTYPDGTVGTVWSPLWHEYATPQVEYLEAVKYANKLFAEGKHRETPKPRHPA